MGFVVWDVPVKQCLGTNTEGVRESHARTKTLKAFANSSPGFALKPWDKGHSCLGNSEGVAPALWDISRPTQPFQGCISQK
jgi:hypothetical protein